MTSEGRRLHQAAVLAGVIDQLRGFVVPILVLAVIGGRGPGESVVRAAIYTGIGIVISTTLAALNWSTTRWFITEDSIRLRTGILSEKNTIVPFDRVQAIDTARGPIQRLFGVVEANVQTAGGGRRAEIVLKAITEAEAEELRNAVRHGTAAAAVPATPEEAREELAWELGPRGLLTAAATSGSLGVLLPFVAAATQWGDNLFGSSAAERLVPNSAGEALRDLGIVIAAAWILSFAGTVAAFARFRLVRDDERLRVYRGLLERREASVQVERVHAVRVVEGPLREPFGLAQIRIDSAGYVREGASAQTIFPLIRRAEAPELIARFLPEFAGDMGGLEHVPSRAARRYILPLALPWLIAAAVLALIVGPPGLLLATGALIGVALGFARYSAAAYRIDGPRVIFRGRRFARSTAVAKPARLQEVHVTANWFQRRGRLATLVVAIGSGRRIGVRHVSDEVADSAFTTLGLGSLGREPTTSATLDM
jgi:putative membrane protein